MYTATFIFAEKQFDEAFHALDHQIAAVARGLPRYLGEESSLQRLVQHPSHLQAKASQSQWLAGYRVVVAEVIRVYGDSKLDDLLPAGLTG
jgi:hypothetical protein